MDFRNKSISFDNVTSMDINKTIQRSLTKACARHGLGLYIYAGEDLPEAERVDIVCEGCGGLVVDTPKRNGEIWKAAEMKAYSERKYHKCLCANCMKDAEKEMKQK
jgi:hypothetical protein